MTYVLNKWPKYVLTILSWFSVDFGFDFELILFLVDFKLGWFWVGFGMGFPIGFELILSCFVLILSYFWFDFVDFLFGLANVEMGYDNAHGLLPKCTIELLFHFACSLHKPKTKLFPKNCVLYLTKRAFCICFLQNGLFGLKTLKQIST